VEVREAVYHKSVLRNHHTQHTKFKHNCNWQDYKVHIFFLWKYRYMCLILCDYTNSYCELLLPLVSRTHSPHLVCISWLPSQCLLSSVGLWLEEHWCGHGGQGCLASGYQYVGQKGLLAAGRGAGGGCNGWTTGASCGECQWGSPSEEKGESVVKDN